MYKKIKFIEGVLDLMIQDIDQKILFLQNEEKGTQTKSRETIPTLNLKNLQNFPKNPKVFRRR